MKIKINPWAIEKNFTQEVGSNPTTIRSRNESEIVIEISSEKESKLLPILKSLYFPQFQEGL